MMEKDPAVHSEQPEVQPVDNDQNHHAAAEIPSNEQIRIQELEQQLEEAKNKHLYLLSDFENLKRNAARERMELIMTAGRDILSALLPVLDDFDRAAQNNALSEGVELIHHKLVHTLQSKGLSSMNVQKGDPFDADRHEAVAELPAAEEALKGKIIDVIDQGYVLGERIIRFAKVVVGR
ncbi:MAG: nucleotide exchange factor GrpE [Saprospiraceae bacterium]|nr:nucleotide exchange factor GrpE [Saprospiraceae bacterium]